MKKKSLYTKVLEELEKRSLEYHLTPCDGYNQVVVYPESKKDSEKNYLVLLNKDDETDECEFFPENYDFEEEVKPYLFVKDIK